VLVGVSGYSRVIVGEMIPSREAHDILSAHLHCLGALGGVPRKGVYDNEGTEDDVRFFINIDRLGEALSRVGPFPDRYRPSGRSGSGTEGASERRTARSEGGAGSDRSLA
jgi:hypothetical protein